MGWLKQLLARKCTGWECAYRTRPVISIMTGNAIIGPVMQRVWNGEAQYREPTASEEMDNLEASVW